MVFSVHPIELSEVKQTGAEGERMKEGAMINKSLSLGVHLALGQIQTHHVEWRCWLQQGVPWVTASKSSRRNLQIQRRQANEMCLKC